MLDVIECPVCGSKSLKPFVNCEDFTVSHETFAIHVCETCALGVTSPRPDVNKLGEYYQSDEYISHSGKSSGGMGFLYKIARSFALRWKADLSISNKTIGKALDFGCGTGEFLQTLKNKGWQVEGVEPSDDARSKAQQTVNQSIHSDLSGVSDKQFDVITAWHVIEHVPDLTDTIKRLKKLLKKDGTIFIAVPNYESPDAATYKSYWAGFDVPRHLWHFSKTSMTKLLTLSGLQLVKIQPMKLDAYYVSMLSEKYKNSNNASLATLLKGFFSGFKSNSRARNKTNYSSLIYIAKNS